MVRQRSLIPDWSIEDSTNAASQGWLLVDVYDLKKKTFGYQILPTKFGTPGVDTAYATKCVIARAQAGDDLARRALTFITQGKHEDRQKK